MARDPIVFAMANPTPEIMPDVAAPYVAVVATGRSDFPNQVNNVLAFPGIFRGALDVRARRITDKMKIAAAYAIAAIVPTRSAAPSTLFRASSIRASSMRSPRPWRRRRSRTASRAATLVSPTKKKSMLRYKA